MTNLRVKNVTFEEDIRLIEPARTGIGHTLACGIDANQDLLATIVGKIPAWNRLWTCPFATTYGTNDISWREEPLIPATTMETPH